MSIQLNVGLESILNYRRLPYKAWYALAELVDNSTQSFFNHREELVETYKNEPEDKLTVIIDYDKDNDLIRVYDNAYGMSYDDLVHALSISRKPENPNGRSKYGLGMKTSSCWLGNKWTIRTSKLGEAIGHKIVIDVNKIENSEDPVTYTDEAVDAEKHYTIVEISELNHVFQGRTLGTIKKYLASIYRDDIRKGQIDITWRGQLLEWAEEDPTNFIQAQDGSYFKKNISFTLSEKSVTGWVGVLNEGSRSKAGFAMLYYGRVIETNWRPGLIFGEARNDLINQRLVGEIHLDDFEVSHTKDNIAWLLNQEEEVEKLLTEACSDYISEARKHRKTTDAPSDVDTKAAIEELRQDIESPTFIDKMKTETVVEEELIEDNKERIIQKTSTDDPDISATIQLNANDTLIIKVFLVDDLSPNDPYCALQAAHSNEIIVIVNQAHPHWDQLTGSQGVYSYIQNCIYDAVSEWKALRLTQTLNPDTIRLLKDDLLRLKFEVSQQ